MQVLVKNPHAPAIHPNGVINSFWSEDCLYMDATFSMTSLMQLSDPVGFSPFLVLDARVAFSIFQLNIGSSLYTRQLGTLGVIGAHLVSNSLVTHEEDKKKFDQYSKEYLPENIETVSSSFDQILTFNAREIDQDLWDKLKVGGTYIVASSRGAVSVNVRGKFEAFGKLWPVGEATEFGWKFNNNEWGLEDFEICKLQKLS
jgi:hypothetical protein